jgi:hypothetical protein
MPTKKDLLAMTDTERAAEVARQFATLEQAEARLRSMRQWMELVVERVTPYLSETPEIRRKRVAAFARMQAVEALMEHQRELVTALASYLTASPRQRLRC